FDTINLLSKNDIVIGLPKLKFVKDHLCSSCELGKAKRKSKDETHEVHEVLINFLRLVQRGLHAQIRRMVVTTEPCIIQSVILKAGVLTDEAVWNASLKRSGKRRGDGEESSKKGNVKGYNKRARIGKVFATITNPVRKEYTGQGGNRPNQAMTIKGGQGHRNNGNSAHGRAFVMGAEEARQDSNIITGIFSFNNHYATMLFDSGADYSFVSTTFVSLLDIEPNSLDYPIWQVIQNGNGLGSIITDTNGIIKVLPPKTAKEVMAREREKKARTTLLMALPKDQLAKIHKMADAKEMWEAIKFRFSGNNESKKMKKYLLKQQFKGFFVSSSEGLHKGYDRTKPGLDTLSFDDLYNNLRLFKRNVKGTTASSSSNTQNVTPPKMRVAAEYCTGALLHNITATDT
nr:xylulose kinase-1 [Tanacetum cinerariifolium]